MVTLGVKEEAAKAAVATGAGAARARARMLAGQPAATLQVDDDFDRAWRRVGLALDRSGFTVEDRDRAQGLYFVRYVDPKDAGKDEPGFFAKLFSFGKDDAPRARCATASLVKAEGERSNVSVQNAQGAPETGDAGQRIVGAAGRRAEVDRRAAPAMRFCSLGSGSGGNATVVEARRRHRRQPRADRLRLLAARARVRAWRAPGCGRDDLDAIFVTHEHGDHIGCAVDAGAPPRHPAVDEPRHLARDRRARARRACCTSRATARPSRSAACSSRPTPCRTTRWSRCNCAAATARRTWAC